MNVAVSNFTAAIVSVLIPHLSSLYQVHLSFYSYSLICPLDLSDEQVLYFEQ
jgi:hypothetical protein